MGKREELKKVFQELLRADFERKLSLLPDSTCKRYYEVVEDPCTLIHIEDRLDEGIYDQDPRLFKADIRKLLAEYQLAGKPHASAVQRVKEALDTNAILTKLCTDALRSEGGRATPPPKTRRTKARQTPEPAAEEVKPKKSSKAVWKRVLDELKRLDASAESGVAMLFHTPVISQYGNIKEAYLANIIQPMDLQTLQTRISKGLIKNDQEFVDTVDLIWLNCWVYNASSDSRPTIYQLAALRMQEEACRIFENEGLPQPRLRAPFDVCYDAGEYSATKHCWGMKALPSAGRVPSDTGYEDMEATHIAQEPPSKTKGARKRTRGASTSSARSLTSGKKGKAGRPTPSPTPSTSPPVLTDFVKKLLQDDQDAMEKNTTLNELTERVASLERLINSELDVIPSLEQRPEDIEMAIHELDGYRPYLEQVLQQLKQLAVQ